MAQHVSFIPGLSHVQATGLHMLVLLACAMKQLLVEQMVAT
jgi:hypothetical protein